MDGVKIKILMQWAKGESRGTMRRQTFPGFFFEFIIFEKWLIGGCGKELTDISLNFLSKPECIWNGIFIHLNRNMFRLFNGKFVGQFGQRRLI